MASATIPLTLSREIEERKAKVEDHDEDYIAWKRTSKRLVRACQRCLDRHTRCDGKKPICGPCDRAGLMSCTYNMRTYTMQGQGESVVWPNCNGDESTESHENTPLPEKREAGADRQLEIEAMMEFSPSDFTMSKKSLTERNQNIVPWDTPVERQDEPTPQTWGVVQGQQKSPGTLPTDFSQFRVAISNWEEYNLLNSMKLYVEYLTGEIWDWWPLRPSFTQLVQDGIRIQWHYDSGHTHWTAFSKPDFVSSQEALKRRVATIQVPPLKRKQPESSSENNSSTSSGTGTSRSSGSESSTGRSSSAISESGSSNQPKTPAKI